MDSHDRLGTFLGNMVWIVDDIMIQIRTILGRYELVIIFNISINFKLNITLSLSLTHTHTFPSPPPPPPPSLSMYICTYIFLSVPFFTLFLFYKNPNDLASFLSHYSLLYSAALNFITLQYLALHENSKHYSA